MEYPCIVYPLCDGIRAIHEFIQGYKWAGDLECIVLWWKGRRGVRNAVILSGVISEWACGNCLRSMENIFHCLCNIRV